MVDISSAPLPAAAPKNDTQLLYDLNMYRHVGAQLSAMAIQSLSNHLWYLVPELAVLAMFDTSVSDNEKLLMSTT